jgi:hypothetical protein
MVWFPCNQVVAAVVMKNWLPFVPWPPLLPALAKANQTLSDVGLEINTTRDTLETRTSELEEARKEINTLRELVNAAEAKVVDFDAAVDESAIFSGVIPENANLASGLQISLAWMATSATSGNCRWGVQIERCTTDLDTDSFDTATEATGAANGTSGIATLTSITVTAIDGLTAGDTFRIRVFRNADDATNDTMTGDAELIAVEVRSAA